MNRFHAIVVSVVCTVAVVMHAHAGLTGKWQGKTASGRPVLLDITVDGKQLTGMFTLNQQSATITEGTVDEKTFSFKATIEGRTPRFDGRLVGDEIELTVEDVPNPLMLKRVKDQALQPQRRQSASSTP